MQKIQLQSMKSIVSITVLLLFLTGVTFISAISIGNHNTRREQEQTDHGYDRHGYINIDCGNSKPESTYYQSDEAFIDTGINRKVSPEYTFPIPPFVMPQFQVIMPPEFSVYSTLRSFPDGERNCYTLRPSNGRDNNYLIRAHFLYGNYDGQNNIPVFDVYIGDSLWDTVNMVPTLSELTLEILHKPKTDVIYVCLVNIGQGTPYISALFLRPLNNSIYSSQLGSLCHRYHRFNTGVVSIGNFVNYVSYSDDIYDRQWSSLPESIGKWEVFNTSNALNHVMNDAYQVPLSILKGGARPHYGDRSLYFATYVEPWSELNVYWHFAETQKLNANESREFSIFTSANFQSEHITLKYMEAVTIVGSAIKIGSKPYFWFTINQTNASSLPPILNAVEIYKVANLSESSTNQDDANAIMDIKTKYGQLKGWNGDPCLPVAPWTGLNCSDDNHDSPRITALNLASKGLTGEILPSLSSLTSLTNLNLSHNELTGMIPEFLAKLPSLTVIDLRENKLSGSVPAELMNKAKSGLLSLRCDD